MKFKPLIPDLGIDIEIKCYNCNNFVSNIDTKTRLCYNCFQSTKSTIRRTTMNKLKRIIFVLLLFLICLLAGYLFLQLFPNY